MTKEALKYFLSGGRHRGEWLQGEPVWTSGALEQMLGSSDLPTMSPILQQDPPSDSKSPAPQCGHPC